MEHAGSCKAEMGDQALKSTYKALSLSTSKTKTPRPSEHPYIELIRVPRSGYSGYKRRIFRDSRDTATK